MFKMNSVYIKQNGKRYLKPTNGGATKDRIPENQVSPNRKIDKGIEIDKVSKNIFRVVEIKKAKKHKKLLTIISNERIISVKAMKCMLYLLNGQKIKKLDNTKPWHRYDYMNFYLLPLRK